MTSSELFLCAFAMGYKKAFLVGRAHLPNPNSTNDELRVYSAEEQGRFELQKRKPEISASFIKGLNAGETEGLTAGASTSYAAPSRGGEDTVLMQKVKLAVFDQAQKLGISNAQAVKILDAYDVEGFQRF